MCENCLYNVSHFNTSSHACMSPCIFSSTFIPYIPYIHNGKILENYLSLQFFIFSCSSLMRYLTIQYIMTACVGTILPVCLYDRLRMRGASSLLYI